MWVHRRGRLNSAVGIESAWKRNDRMFAFSTLSKILTSPRGCVWQTHFTVHWLQEARHPCSKTFLPRNILFPFPAGTAWPGLKFFVSGARQLLIFVSSCFPQHKGRPWLPSKQLPTTFQHPKAWFSISVFQMPGFFSAQTCLHLEEPEDSYWLLHNQLSPSCEDTWC